MICLIVLVQRPHWAVQPKPPYTWLIRAHWLIALRICWSDRTLHEHTITIGSRVRKFHR
jgi:hypothetical protein